MCHITPHILRGERSRSSFKVKGQMKVKTALAHSNVIFGIDICHITPHFLKGEMSRSRSFFKVKGQIESKKRATLSLVITFHLLQIAT